MNDAVKDGDDIPHGMTDLEERLQGAEGPALRATLMSRLAQLAGELDAKVNEGLPPNDYSRATEMKAAIGIAQSILRGGTDAKDLIGELQT